MTSTEKTGNGTSSFAFGPSEKPTTPLLSAREIALVKPTNGKILPQDFSERENAIKTYITMLSSKTESDRLHAAAVIRDIFSFPTDTLSTTLIPADASKQTTYEVIGTYDSLCEVSEQSFARHMQITLLKNLQQDVFSNHQPILSFPASPETASSLIALYTQVHPAKEYPPINTSQEHPLNQIFEPAYQSQVIQNEIASVLAGVVSKNNPLPSFGRTIINALAEESTRNAFEENLTDSKRSMGVLSLLDALSSNTTYYTDQGVLTQNSTLLFHVIVNNERFDTTIYKALRRLDKASSLKLQKLYTGELSPVENLRVKILTKIEQLGVENYETDGSRSLSSLALADLMQLVEENTEPISTLKITKAFLLESYDKKGSIESILLRAFIRSALTANPDLFNGLAPDLQQYLTKLEDEFPSFPKAPNITTPPVRLRERLTANAPLVFQMGCFESEGSTEEASVKPNVGLGDTLLTIPVIRDIAETAKKIGSTSKIYFIVRDKMVSMVQAMLADYPQVEILNALSYANESDKLKPLLAPTEERGYPGILLAYRPVAMREEHFSKSNILFQELQLPITHPASDTTGTMPTFAQSRNAELSFLFGMDFSSGLHELTGLREGLNKFVDDYTAAHPEVQEQIAKLHEQFPNGFVVMVSSGSTVTKSFSLDFDQETAALLAKSGFGVLFLDTHKVAQDQRAVEDAFAKHTVAVNYLRINEATPVAATLALMREATFGIMPDSFLIHAFEILSENPAINVATDSNVDYFRFAGSSVIPVYHPIGEEANNMHRILTNNETEFLNNTYPEFHVLDIAFLDNAEQASHLHPIIQATQQLFRERYRNTVRKLLTNTNT